MQLDCGKCGQTFTDMKKYTAHLPCVVKTVPEPGCTCRTRPWKCPVHPRRGSRGL